MEIARIVKQHLDEKRESYWHVFLWKSFGCHAVHEKRSFKYFTFEESNILFLLSILNTEIFNSIGESWLGVLGFINYEELIQAWSKYINYYKNYYVCFFSFVREQIRFIKINNNLTFSNNIHLNIISKTKLI